jgi:hypothetical protein
MPAGRIALLIAALGSIGAADVMARVYTAAQVVSYWPGARVSAALTNPIAALSLPSASTGTGNNDGNFSPYNPHYAGGEIVQVGEGGSLTLRLERFVHPLSGVPSLGVWENIFLLMGSGGLSGSPAAVFGADSAWVEASADGINFVPAGFFTFSWFGNYWTESSGPYAKTGGGDRADFGRPHGLGLAEFSGLTYAGIMSLLNGTAGGTWIDLTTSGLERVGWIRFSGIPAGTTLEIDAVAINSALAGEPTALPQLRIEIAGELTRVTIPSSLTHAIYQLQHSELPSQGWVNLGPVLSGTGGDLVFTDETTPRPDKRFYRIVIP